MPKLRSHAASMPEQSAPRYPNTNEASRHTNAMLYRPSSALIDRTPCSRTAPRSFGEFRTQHRSLRSSPKLLPIELRVHHPSSVLIDRSPRTPTELRHIGRTPCSPTQLRAPCRAPCSPTRLRAIGLNSLFTNRAPRSSTELRAQVIAVYSYIAMGANTYSQLYSYQL